MGSSGGGHCPLLGAVGALLLAVASGFPDASALPGYSDSTAEKYAARPVLVGTKLYAVPYSAPTVLVIDTNDDSHADLAGFSDATVEKYKADPVLVGATIYAVPYGASKILRINTEDDTFGYVSGFTRGTEVFEAAPAAFGDKVVAISRDWSGNGYALVVDVATDFATLIVLPSHYSTKSYIAPLIAAGRYVYALPDNGNRMVVIDPAIGAAGYVELSDFTNVDVIHTVLVGTQIYGLTEYRAEGIVIETAGNELSGDTEGRTGYWSPGIDFTSSKPVMVNSDIFIVSTNRILVKSGLGRASQFNGGNVVGGMAVLGTKQYFIGASEIWHRNLFEESISQVYVNSEAHAVDSDPVGGVVVVGRKMYGVPFDGESVMVVTTRPLEECQDPQVVEFPVAGCTSLALFGEADGEGGVKLRDAFTSNLDSLDFDSVTNLAVTGVSILPMGLVQYMTGLTTLDLTGDTLDTGTGRLTSLSPLDFQTAGPPLQDIILPAELTCDISDSSDLPAGEVCVQLGSTATPTVKLAAKRSIDCSQGCALKDLECYVPTGDRTGEALNCGSSASECTAWVSGDSVNNLTCFGLSGTLGPIDFTGFPSLEVLVLEGTISSLGAGTFACGDGYPLDKLVLRGNAITTVSATAFINCPALSQIDLGENQILHALPPELFPPVLTNLWLDNNDAQLLTTAWLLEETISDSLVITVDDSRKCAVSKPLSGSVCSDAIGGTFLSFEGPGTVSSLALFGTPQSCLLVDAALSGCSTSGGDHISLTGQFLHLGTNDLIRVTVGGEPCAIVDAQVSSLVFAVPEHAGRNRSVNVWVRGAPAQLEQEFLVNYKDPVITAITSEDCGPDDDEDVDLLCPRDGGSLTIEGSDFGKSNAVVFIGDAIVTASHAEGNPHSRIVVDLPPGYKLNQPVVVVPNNGIASNPKALSYTQCSPGTFQNGAEQLCALCPASTFSDEYGLLECKPCGPGRTSEPGASDCEVCQPYSDPDSLVCQCKSGYVAVDRATYASLDWGKWEEQTAFVSPFVDSLLQMRDQFPLLNTSDAFLCIKCPAEADCDAPGQNITHWKPRAGYSAGDAALRGNGQPALHFYACESGCEASGECTQGRKGVMCAVCETGMMKTEEGCEICQNAELSIAVAILYFVVYSYYISCVTAKGRITKSMDEQDASGAFIKIFVSGMQLNAMAKMMPLTWPESVTTFDWDVPDPSDNSTLVVAAAVPLANGYPSPINDLLEAQEKVAMIGPNLISLDCAVDGAFQGGLRTFYFTSIYYLAMPVLLVIISALATLYLGRWVKGQIKAEKELREELALLPEPEDDHVGVDNNDGAAKEDKDEEQKDTEKVEKKPIKEGSVAERGQQEQETASKTTAKSNTRAKKAKMLGAVGLSIAGFLAVGAKTDSDNDDDDDDDDDAETPIKTKCLRALCCCCGPSLVPPLTRGEKRKKLKDNTKTIKPWRNLAFTNIFASVFVILCFMLHPKLTDVAFQYFHCQQLGTFMQPQEYLVADLHERCWDGDHLTMALGVGIPLLVLCVVGLPATGFFILWRGYKRGLVREAIELEGGAQSTEAHNFAAMYGFLFKGYDVDRFYWEVVVTLRKIAMQFLVVFFSKAPQVQSYLITCLLIAIVALTLDKAPYMDQYVKVQNGPNEKPTIEKVDHLSTFENVSLSVSFAIFFGGQYLFFTGVPVWTQKAITVLISSVVLVFVMAFAKYMLIAKRESLVEYLPKLPCQCKRAFKGGIAKYVEDREYCKKSGDALVDDGKKPQPTKNKKDKTKKNQNNNKNSNKVVPVDDNDTAVTAGAPPEDDVAEKAAPMI
jgi:hypothetical protein